MLRTQKKRRRLILVPLPYQGHITPMLQLATFLHHHGFSITIAHVHFSSPNPSNHPEFEFLLFEDDISAQNNSISDLVSTLWALNHGPVCKPSLAKLLTEKLKEEKDNEGEVISCGVVYDECMYFCESVAADLNLKSIILRTASSTTLLARDVILELHDQGRFPFPDSIMQDPVRKLHPLRFKDLPISVSSDLRKVIPLYHNICSCRTSSAVIWNTSNILEASSISQLKHQFPIPIFPMGPLHKIIPSLPSSSLLEEDGNCISWLNNKAKNTVLYVSLGSVMSLSREDFEEMAWGLAQSEKAFIWVVRSGLVRGLDDGLEVLPNGFEESVGERGLIVKWAPQKELLAHEAVGGFWSHCGWNSTLESICEGVPILCTPGFADQKVNARYVSCVWRVGLELENGFERGEIERGVRSLMDEKEGEEMRERASDLKEKIEEDLREGGCSYNCGKELLEFIYMF